MKKINKFLKEELRHTVKSTCRNFYSCESGTVPHHIWFQHSKSYGPSVCPLSPALHVQPAWDGRQKRGTPRFHGDEQ